MKNEEEPEKEQEQEVEVDASATSTPSTPPSPLPVSVGPGNQRYAFSSSSASPASSSHVSTEELPLLQDKVEAVVVVADAPFSAFSLDWPPEPSQRPVSRSSCLKDLPDSSQHPHSARHFKTCVNVGMVCAEMLQLLLLESNPISVDQAS